MATTVSVPGASGTPIVFKVNGTSTINYAVAFQNAVGNDTVQVLSNPQTQVAGPNILNDIFSNTSTNTFALQFGNQHTFVDVGLPTTVTGSSQGGDTVLATGSTTYDATGPNNQVTFVSGANNYVGGTGTGDTITGGSGADTINTSTGFSTVFSGAGNGLIVLNDTVGSSGSAPGDLVYLGDGHSTVLADGHFDDVIAATNGQTIFGGTDSTSTLNVVVGDNATSSGPSGDIITAGAGTTNIFDSVGGSSIFGGSGPLTFVGGSPAAGGTMSDSIVGGSGSSVIFGASGDNISFAGDTSGSVATFVAGTGNETLNAANADGRANFFGSNDSSSSATFVGSETGYNYFQTGGNDTTGGTATGGSETLFGGNGTNIFGINDGGTSAHVTIYDFAAGNDSVNFLGETTAQVQADLNSATSNTFGLTVTLSDQSTVTFVGLSSVSQLHVANGSGSNT